MTDGEHDATVDSERDPNVHANLRVLAAKYALGMLPSDDLPKLAVDLLEAGVDSEALANLAGGTRLDHPADLRQLFEVGLKDCSVRVPRRLEAAAQLKIHFAHQVAMRDVSPAQGAAWIVSLYRAVELELPRSNRYVGENFGIARLYGLCDSLYDLRDDDDSRQSVELEIIKECSTIAGTRDVAQDDRIG